MEVVKLKAVCPDLSMVDSNTLLSIVRDDPSDIIIFPEYLLELVDYPKHSSEKLIIWGSKIDRKQNRIFFQTDNQVNSVAKMRLTPWENDLLAGDQLKVFDFRGIKIAIIICFDVEFPDLAVELKQKNIDLLLVPSATETILGYERVNRCASSRAVELGCAVVTCHLIGETSLEMIDKNVGNHNLFLPSQSLFEGSNRTIFSEPLWAGGHEKEFIIPIEKIRQQRLIQGESNPSLR